MERKIFLLQLLLITGTAISNAQYWRISNEAPAGLTNTQPPSCMNRKIFCLAGKDYIHDKLVCYDLEKNIWTNTSTKLIWNRHHGAMASFNGKVYLAGGCIGDNDSVEHRRIGYTEMYDPLLEKWIPCNSMITPRAGFHMVTFMDKIYALGGIDHDSIPINTIEVYDPLRDKWAFKTKAPWKGSLFCWGAGIYNNNIYIIGKDASGIVFMRYNPQNDSFTEIATQLPANLNSPGVCICGNFMMIAGGATNKPVTYVHIFDFKNNQWSAFPELPSARAFPCAVSDGNKVYIIGGIGPDWDWANPNKTIFETDLKKWMQSLRAQ